MLLSPVTIKVRVHVIKMRFEELTKIGQNTPLTPWILETGNPLRRSGTELSEASARNPRSFFPNEFGEERVFESQDPGRGL